MLLARIIRMRWGNECAPIYAIELSLFHTLLKTHFQTLKQPVPDVQVLHLQGSIPHSIVER